MGGEVLGGDRGVMVTGKANVKVWEWIYICFLVICLSLVYKPRGTATCRATLSGTKRGERRGERDFSPFLSTPGVSRGSMAFLSSIYSRFVSNIFEQISRGTGIERK